MAEQQSSTAADAVASSKATETLSQFSARVLDQLSLSAWLPSAALVLSVTYIVQLGIALDAPHNGVWEPVNAAFGAIGQTKVGGALLLFAAVIVLTIFTQAFAFEAIRFFEGYWGAKAPFANLARALARHYNNKTESLTVLSSELTAEAWRTARTKIESLQADAVDRNASNDLTGWTPDILTWLGGQVTRQKTIVQLSRASQIAALNIPWRDYADPEPLRRCVVVDKHRRDFPAAHRTLPTKFGNIIRAHEDQTGRAQVETFVLDVLHLLPPPLRRLHDDARNRLDLYVTMIFVEFSVAVSTLVRTLPNHWGYGASISGGMLVVAWLTYRAAMASGRIYGTVLVQIAALFPATTTSQASVPTAASD